MKIALISRGCRPGAGIESYAYELARRLAPRHDVHVLTNPREATECGVRVVPVNSPARPLWHSILSFSSRAGFEAQKHHYDVVHTQGSDGRWGHVVTAHSCHLAGMRASLKLHPTFGNRFRKWFSPTHRAVVQMERSAFSSARRIIAVSQRVRRQIQAAYPCTRRIPVRVIYPGVDNSVFSPDTVSRLRPDTRSRLGFTNQDILFLLVANAPRLKGAERLIRALALTRPASGHLLIATGQAEKTKMEQLARRAGVSDRVHFLHAGMKTLAAFAAADIYIALPEYESFGLTVLEAMSCALPVVVTRNAGAAELMTDGQDGVLLPALVADSNVARVMETLAANPEQRAALGQRARQTAAAYTWERMVTDIEETYAQTMRELHGLVQN